MLWSSCSCAIVLLYSNLTASNMSNYESLIPLPCKRRSTPRKMYDFWFTWTKTFYKVCFLHCETEVSVMKWADQQHLETFSRTGFGIHPRSEFLILRHWTLILASKIAQIDLLLCRLFAFSSNCYRWTLGLCFWRTCEEVLFFDDHSSGDRR